MEKQGVYHAPKFKSGLDIRNIANRYFDGCQGEVMRDIGGEIMRDKQGIPMRTGVRPPTLVGLALALGFDSRQGFLAYGGRPSVQYELNRAKAYVEEYTQERLFDKDGIGGAKFILANDFTGWSERPREGIEAAALEKLDLLMEGIENATKR